MHIPRRPRVPRRLLPALALLLALAAVAGCRSDPGVAAYVGQEQISVSQLQKEVDQRLADPRIAQVVGKDTAGYQRVVLSRLINRELYAQVAQRFGVRVPDEEVSSRLPVLIGTDDAAFYDSWAQQGVTRQDIFEEARQQLILQQIAVSKGRPDELTEQALRARFQQAAAAQSSVDLGFITVPDQATASAVLGQLTANPGSYPDLAARYPGNTLPRLQNTKKTEVPQVLADGVARTAPGNGFTVTVPGAGGVTVVYVGAPTFEESRSELLGQAIQSAQDAVGGEVDRVRSATPITVNPRFGTYQDGQVVVQGQDGKGVVDILGTRPPTG